MESEYLIKTYIRSIQKAKEKFSNLTIQMYKQDLYYLYNKFKTKDIQEFLSKSYDFLNRIPFNTKKRIISSYNSFIRFLIKKNIVSKNYIIKNFSKVSNKIRIADDKEFQSLFFKLRNEKHKLLKIELLYTTGIKLNELINLQKSNLKKLKGVYFIKIHDRYIPISRDLYSNLINNTSKDKDGYLFVNKHGKQYTYRNIRAEISNFVNRAGTLTISPSTLRNNFILRKLRENTTIEEIAYLTGISNKNYLKKFLVYIQREKIGLRGLEPRTPAL